MLMDVASGKSVHTSSKLNAVLVENIRKDGKKADPVEEVMEKFFDAVDKTYTLDDMPDAPASAVAGRVAKLAEAKPDDVLETMVEIAYWHKKGLLKDAEALAAYEKLIGPEGAKLLSPSPFDRAEALAKVVPQAGAAGTATGGGKRLGLGSP
jgi:hypothetical protein